MLQLVSNNGQASANFGLLGVSKTSQAVEKCLRFLNTVIKINCRLKPFDITSETYHVLINLAQTKNHISIGDKIYLPIFFNHSDTVWGFIEVYENTDGNHPTAGQIRKAILAIKDIIEPELIETFTYHPTQLLNSIFVLESSVNTSHRLATNIFYNKKYTSFINLAEWAHSEDNFTIAALRGFDHCLLYIPEIQDLTPRQRLGLAAYEMLPIEMKSSSLFICTRLSNFEVNQIFKEEPRFLAAFKDKKSILNDNLAKKLSL